jgi:epoxyqueuosine reductase
VKSVNADDIKQKALELGFHKAGISAVSCQNGSPIQASVQRLQRWLDQGHQAKMDWMADPRRQDICKVMPEVRAVISVALNYYTPDAQSNEPAQAKISRYGWGRDYHKVLQRRLKALSIWLEAQGEGIEARYYVDTGPIQEKAWAQQAGLGWVGKHDYPRVWLLGISGGGVDQSRPDAGCAPH